MMVASSERRGRAADALERDEIYLAYQPIIEASSGHVGHYEALLRIIAEDGKDDVLFRKHCARRNENAGSRLIDQSRHNVERIGQDLQIESCKVRAHLQGG